MVSDFEGEIRLDRALCETGTPDEEGKLLFNFADNGFIDRVEPGQIFELDNYHQVAAVPPQVRRPGLLRPGDRYQPYTGT